MERLRQIALMLSRFLIAGWIGAAALFVVTSVAEQISPDLDSTVKEHLALIRFPHYYTFGFTMMCGGLLTVLLTYHKGVPKRWWVATTFLAISLSLMVIDYFVIYLPLEEMLTPVGSPIPAEFIDYHNYSRRINEVHITFALIAALILCSTGISKHKPQ